MMTAILTQSFIGTHYNYTSPDTPLLPEKKEELEPGFMVLSLDGGGVRGYLQLCLLADLETKMGKPVGEVADLIAGTSVGGIFTMILLKKDPNNPNKCQYSANWLKSNFPSLAAQVFNKKQEWLFTRIFKAVVGIFWDIQHPEYSPEGIEAIGNQFLNDEFAKNAKTHFCITAYELGERMRTFFITLADVTRGIFANISMKNLSRLTSAAPIYFPPASYANRKFLDGGVMCNNPALVAFQTAQKLAAAGTKINVLSLGTGIAPTSLDLNIQSKHWGLLEVAPALIDLFLNTQERLVDAEMQKRPPGLGSYHRIQTYMDSAPSLDAATPKTWTILENAAQTIISHPEWTKVVALWKKASISKTF